MTRKEYRCYLVALVTICLVVVMPSNYIVAYVHGLLIAWVIAELNDGATPIGWLVR